jgi:UDP-N-acetylmuramoyl-L-alanyl-D-glutamate--2,6-diaminopimelate ligase
MVILCPRRTGIRTMPMITLETRMYNVAGFPCSGASFIPEPTAGASMVLRDLMVGSMFNDRLPEIAVSGLQLDSRKVQPGDLFFALAGSRQHGLLHAREAIALGAVAIVYDPAGGGSNLAKSLRGSKQTAMVAVPALDQELGWIADRFYGAPSAHMEIIGITGTNGKTSCSHFLARALTDIAPCAVMGTLGWGFLDALQPSSNTTPDAIAIQAGLAKLKKQGAKAVAMEVSSHGQVQGRTQGVRFKGAVYTNISRDHLDYHGTMEAYLQAKLRLLEAPGLAFAVINLDDPYSERILAAVPAGIDVLGFTRYRRTEDRGQELGSIKRICAENVRHDAEGLSFDVIHGIERARLSAPVLGDFNVENVLATVAVLLKMGLPLEKAVQRLALIRPVSGRMERFTAGPNAPAVVIDYAHTPDALERLLDSVRMHCSGKLWLLFGCGGDRDQGKRAHMGRIARQAADRIVITDDNPRYEDGSSIIDAILVGCCGGVEVIRDRAEAIKTTIMRAAANDLVVVAGKGHEGYQEIQDIRHPFSDRKVVEAALMERRVHNWGSGDDDAAE